MDLDDKWILPLGTFEGKGLTERSKMKSKCRRHSKSTLTTRIGYAYLSFHWIGIYAYPRSDRQICLYHTTLLLALPAERVQQVLRLQVGRSAYILLQPGQFAAIFPFQSAYNF